MRKHVRFWRNVTLIGLAHVVVIYGLIRWNRETKAANHQSIVWMSDGGGGGSSTATLIKAGSSPYAEGNVTSTPEPQPSRTEEINEDEAVLTSAKSDIQLPIPKPSVASTPKPTPRAVAKVTPRPTPKPTSKPTPKPTPKPTVKPKPKPSPKKLTLAKASPKPSPRMDQEREGSEDNAAATTAAEKKSVTTPTPAKQDEGSSDSKQAVHAQTDTAKSGSAGAGGHAGGSGGESQFGWYGSMLHDRFYSEWNQPSAIASAGAKTSVLVKIRIEKDGRVSSFETIKSSGNSAIDESVAAIAKRVTQVDPLPSGLGNGDHYDVKVNFELNSEQ